MNSSKVILLLVLFLASVNAVKGQDLIILSELSSHFRGNKSANLSFQMNNRRIINSIGFAYIYKIKHPERAIQRSPVSYGLNYKIGYHFNNKINPNRYIVGIDLKYSKFNIHQLDSEFNKPWYNKENVYDKSYSKITPMLFFQIEHTKYNRIYFGLQFAIGIPYIYDVKVKINNEYEGLTVYEGGLDYSDLYEHGYHRNASGPFTSYAFQFNFSVGYKIIKSVSN